MAQDPHDAPVVSSHRAAPDCHTSSPHLRDAFRRTYRAFVVAFRAATCRLTPMLEQLSQRALPFPDGAFPRPRWFRAAEPLSWSKMMIDVALRALVGRGTP